MVMPFLVLLISSHTLHDDLVLIPFLTRSRIQKEAMALMLNHCNLLL